LKGQVDLQLSSLKETSYPEILTLWSVISAMPWGTTRGETNAEEVNIGDVPVHLLSFYEETKGKSTYEKVRVKNLLCKHSDTFSKD
jgi:hypothetical protein